MVGVSVRGAPVKMECLSKFPRLVRDPDSPYFFVMLESNCPSAIADPVLLFEKYVG
jgi:hypothetical protein